MGKCFLSFLKSLFFTVHVFILPVLRQVALLSILFNFHTTRIDATVWGTCFKIPCIVLVEIEPMISWLVVGFADHYAASTTQGELHLIPS